MLKFKSIFERMKKFLFSLKFKLFKRKNNEIYFINGSEVLPEPLKRDAEIKIFEMLKTNEKKARELLIVHNLRLVVYIARKFESTQICIEDLISIGSIGLIKAVKTFCPERNIKLATYASRCIENEILMFIRKTQGQKNEFSIDEPLNIDWDGNELLLSDILGTEEDSISKNFDNDIEKSLLYNAVDKLPKREKEIMNMRFGLSGNKEKTQKEVADLIGISQSYISRLEKRIIKKLRCDLEKVG